MKPTLPCLLLMLVSVNCHKKDDPGPYWGEVSALVNGQPWYQQFTYGETWQVKISGVAENDASNQPCNQRTFELQIYRFTADDLMREALALDKIPRQPGTYALIGLPVDCQTDTLPSASFATLQDDGDVLQDYYRPLKSATNVVTVSNFNASTGEVRGTFQVTFVIER